MPQQPRPTADRLPPSYQPRQKQKEVRRGRVQKSKSKERLTTIPSPLPPLTSGRSASRRSSVRGRLEVPQPDSPHDRGQVLEEEDDSMDSHHGEYEDNLNGSHNRESEEEADLIELDEDDEDPVADLGGQRPITGHEFESQRSIMTLTVTPTQRTGSYPGRKTPGPRRVSPNCSGSILPGTRLPAGSSGVTPTLTPSQSRSATPELDPIAPVLTSSRRNTAVGIELVIQTKARELMWDWTLFTDPFPDPITLTEMIRKSWTDAP